ncbi:MAG: SET domain-containing protein [Leptospiraceae bacterium]|nr:SET domain-containing protein [Leptospiraceae bacterium]
MMLVESYLKESKIHGIGCFAKNKIKANEMIWIYDEKIDRRYSVKDIKNWPEVLVAYLMTYGYAEKFEGEDYLVLCGDNGKHMNHSSNPNIYDDFKINANFALRDIEADEEITCNYHAFDIYANMKLTQKV